MVKGYDTTTSDPSKLLLDYLFTFFDSTRVTLSPEKASSYLKQWMKSSPSTSEIYKKFQHMSIKPSIILRKNCPKSFFSNVPYQGGNNFGSFQNEEEIHVCLNSIKNKMELKENIDRQLYFMYYKNVAKQHQQNENSESRDRELIQNLYESCKQGYRNYGWERQTTERLGKKCAVYLFRRRSLSDLPPDSLFRYASRIADQYCL